MDGNYSMSSIELSAIREHLSMLISLRDRQNERLSELSDYDSTILKRKVVNGKEYYYYRNDPHMKFKYAGTMSSEIVLAVKEARFLKKSIEAANNNIAIVDAMLKDYVPIDIKLIDNALPLAYRDHTGLIHSPQRKSNTHEGAHDTLNLSNGEEVITHWLDQMASIKTSFPVKNPEQLRHIYIDGTPFRSKSELLERQAFDLHGIPCAYEVPIVIDGYTIYTDFRLLSPVDLRTEFLLEHFGRMDDDGYQETVGWKISKYMKAGYMPNVNFFMTFDDVDGNLDMRPFYDILRKITQA